MKPPPFDPYALLELPHGATEGQVKAAYRRLALRHHPDRSGHADAAPLFVRITEAYELLTDPVRRRAYDERLDRERRLRAEAAARARQHEAEQRHASDDLIERSRRAAAQREQAQRAQAERDAQMSRILGRAYQKKPDWQAGDQPHLVDMPAAPTEARQEIYDLRDAVHDKTDRRWEELVEPAYEPVPQEPADVGETDSRGAWATDEVAWAAACVLPLVAAVGCSLWYLVQGAWLAAALSLIVVPVPVFLACLGAFFPLAAVLVVITSLIRLPLGRSWGEERQSPAATRVTRLVRRYLLEMAGWACGAALVAWLALGVAPGQPESRREPLLLVCDGLALLLGYAVLALTVTLMFALLDGRESLHRRPPPTLRQLRPRRSIGESADSNRGGKRTLRGSRECRHAAAL